MTPAGVVASPNIWQHPGVYELENRAVDPDGVIAAAMRSVRGWHDATVLDVGCGSGYHLPWFAADAARVVGVEPHPPLVELARRRAAGLATVDVRAGTAQRLPLPDASVDVAHARWAYFFGPGSEPGLRELARVVRRGGTAFVIDNDGTRSTFGRWFSWGYPTIDPVSVERFWARNGWTRTPVLTRLSFDSEADLEAVVGIEFDAGSAARILADQGTSG